MAKKENISSEPDAIGIYSVYATLASKYSLPDFNRLNHEFEISTIECNAFLIRNIRKAMTERIEFFIKIIEDIIQPEAALPTYHEYKAFGDEDKKDLFDLYKKLMQIQRTSLLLAIVHDESKDAEFIKSVFAEWGSIKEAMAHIIQKIRDSWESDILDDEGVGYIR